MEPQAAADPQSLIAALVGLVVFAFFIFALVRARRSRREQMDALEPKSLREGDKEVIAPPETLEEEPDALEAPPTQEEVIPAQVREVDSRLAQGLAKTKEGLLSRIGGLFVGKEIPADLLQQVETILLTSDIGVKTTQALLGRVKEALSRSALKDQGALVGALKDEVEKVLDATYKGDWTLVEHHPTIILMVGVNGVGKTTTIGKLASKFRAEGKTVMVAAGDTFRAAAADQLKIWAERAGAEYYAGAQGKDPASVVFEACEKAKASNIDIVLCDTAGRLHTKTNLMDELKKVKRVVGKVIANAPHEVFLVVDGTTGQNAVTQAREFNEAMGLTGIVLTKLDGTAKGGVVVAIAAELNVPIRFVGVGETAEDLRRFDPHTFSQALFA